MVSRSLSLPVSVAATLLAAAVSANDYEDYNTFNVRTVSKKNMKCAGAPGKPYVHYVPCEEGYACTEKTTYSAGEWGRYCMPASKDYYVGKCHKTGDRCMGAAGKPYVEYLPCCTKGKVCREMTSDDKAYGAETWGRYCISYKGDTVSVDKYMNEKPKYDSKHSEYDSKFYDYKCHVSGARCASAPGFPHVEYGNGCCYGSDSCVSDAYIGWGKFCKLQSEVYSDYEKYKEDPKSYKPPTYDYESWNKAPKETKSDEGPYNPYSPSKCYGYGCADMKKEHKMNGNGNLGKNVTTSLDNTIGIALQLGANFGCGGPGTAAAMADNIPDDINDDQGAIRVSVAAPPCSDTSVFSAADARAFLNKICEVVTAIDSTAQCFLEVVPASGIRMLEDASELDVSVRQGGGIITIYIVFLLTLQGQILAALNILASLFGGIVSIVITASPDA